MLSGSVQNLTDTGRIDARAPGRNLEPHTFHTVSIVLSPLKIKVRSDDGASSKITVFPALDERAPTIICMPAMGVKASFYEPLAHNFVKKGLNVVTADLRGHGDSGIRPSRTSDFGYGDMVVYDWPCIIDQTKNHFPDSLKIILGHSLGGQLSTLYLSEKPEKATGLILVAAPSLYYRDWPFPHGLRLLLMTQTFALIASVLGYHPGRKLRIGGTEARRLVSDWARIARKGRYDMIRKGVDYEKLSRNLEMPVLSISFSDDGFAPKRAGDRLCQRMPLAELTRWHLTPGDLGCSSLGHFSWVKQSERLVSMITNWIEAVSMS